MHEARGAMHLPRRKNAALSNARAASSSSSKVPML